MGRGCGGCLKTASALAHERADVARRLRRALCGDAAGSPLLAPIEFVLSSQPLWSTALVPVAGLTTDAGGRAAMTVFVPSVPEIANSSVDLIGAQISGGAVQWPPPMSLTVRL